MVAYPMIFMKDNGRSDSIDQDTNEALKQEWNKNLCTTFNTI